MITPNRKHHANTNVENHWEVESLLILSNCSGFFNYVSVVWTKFFFQSTRSAWDLLCTIFELKYVIAKTGKTFLPCVVIKGDLPLREVVYITLLFVILIVSILPHVLNSEPLIRYYLARVLQVKCCFRL